MSDDVRIVPPIPPALVRHLKEVFPERCPDPQDTEREIWMKAGERRLVTWLATRLAFQEDTN